MQVQVVSHQQPVALAAIKQTLLQKWLGTKANAQRRCQLFDQSIHPACDELAYAIMTSPEGEIVLVASLYAEYKLTRNLCTTYHLKIEYQNCTREQEQQFQAEAVRMIPGYKIMALSLREGSIFKPHQVFMEVQLYDQTLKGNL